MTTFEQIYCTAILTIMFITYAGLANGIGKGDQDNGKKKDHKNK